MLSMNRTKFRTQRRNSFESLEGRELLAADIYYYATDGGNVVNSDGSQLRVTNHDIVELTVEDNGTHTHKIFFNGDSVGLDNPSSNLESITAFAIDNDGGLLFVPRVRANVGGIQTEPGDILKFRSTSLGARTAGSWSLFFDASDVGFPTLADPNPTFGIDALDVLDDGRLLISLGGNAPRVGNVNLDGLSVNNKDLLSFQFAPGSTPANTRGTWSVYASDDRLGLTRSLGTTDENMVAVWADEDVVGQPKFLFSTAEAFTIEHGGGSGRTEDIGILSRSGLNANFRLEGREIIGANRGLGNDDISAFHKARPEIFIADQGIVEGDSGTKSLGFRVTLTEPTSKTVSVNYRTQNGSATAWSSDYTARSGRVTWGPGQVGTRIVNVPIRGDLIDENNENFRVLLSNAVNAIIVDGVAVGTIVDDDPKPTQLVISDVQAVEGDVGVKDFVFTVTPSQVTSAPITVNYATADGTATTANRDYVARSGQLSWPANSSASRRIFVSVRGDGQSEGDEAFFVRLSNATNASIADGVGVGTVLDDDTSTPPPPGGGSSLSISDVRQLEGTGGGANFVFTVNLSRPSTQPVSVNYMTADGSATAANRDYVSKSGTLSWPVNATSPRRVFVWVRADDIGEADENFFVRLANPVNASLTDSEATGTIVNDDSGTIPNPPPPSSAPSLRIADVQALERTGGGSNFVFTVTPSKASAVAMSVDFTTVDGTATTADRDYVRQAGKLSWPAGTAAPRRVFVWVAGDSRVEPNEMFQIRLSNAVNATIADSLGLATILNDDTLRAIAASMEFEDDLDVLAKQHKNAATHVDETIRNLDSSRLGRYSL